MTEATHIDATGAMELPATISVIVPVRNDPSRLRRCLYSLRQSDFSDYELIVVDDASTDNTPEVAAEMGAIVIRLPRRVGPAAARNRGANAASAPCLFFLDADVCAHPDTVRRVATFFQEYPAFDAVIGSYDLEPAAPSLISQYKNLCHRFVHQAASQEACTFWTGCGAIRRSAFLEFGGFDTSYSRPSIEDIDLGARLCRAGRRIRLDKQLEAKHLKRWTLWGMIRSDIFDRGVPWTRLILRERDLPRDLNLTLEQRLSAAVACMVAALLFAAVLFAPRIALLPIFAVIILLAADWLTSRATVFGAACRMVLLVGAVVLLCGAAAISAHAPWWSCAIGALLAVIIALNARFYWFFVRHRGVGFAVLAVPLHVIYFLCCAGALSTGIILHTCRPAVVRKIEHGTGSI